MQLSTLLRSLGLFIGLIGVTGLQSVSAQAFIPDLNMRSWLNNAIPGIVDGNGIMDTLHVGIAELYTLDLVGTGMDDVIDLEGIQYLDSLLYFSADLNSGSGNQSVTCGALPPSIESFMLLSSGSGTISVPQFPETTRSIILGDLLWGPKTIVIAGLPQDLTTLRLLNCESVSWGNMVQVDYFILRNNDPTIAPSSWTFPSISASDLTLDGIEADQLDLSAISAGSLALYAVNIDEITWPQNTLRLFVEDCNLSSELAPFPNTLENITLANAVTGCLPNLPAGLDTLVIYNGFNCLPNLPDSLTYFSCNSCLDANENIRHCSLLNNDCPGSDPRITGRAYIDTDQNGQYTVGEPGVPQVSIITQPLGYVSDCNPSGYWVVRVPPGNHTISPTTSYPYIQSYSPTVHIANVPNDLDLDTLNDFAVTLMPNIQDLRAQLYAEPARPGFNNRLFLHADNYGTMPTVAQLTLNFDADQTWVGSSVAPTSLAGNTAVWDLATLDFAEQVNLTVDLATAASIPLGTPLAHTLTADPVNTDQTPLNNVIFYNDSVVGSFDPNDKLLTPEKLPLSTVQGGYIPLEYTIRFQNTGTYPAERVIIVDTLSEDLQWNSFEFLSSSHPCHWYINDGVLHFIHEGIVLPDSTNDEPNSHGYVKFRIKPSTDLLLGATVTNIAHIVFDFNEPIVTPPAVFTIDELTGVEELSSSGISVYPNPVEGVLTISFANTSPNGSYVIRNVLGQSVMQGRLNGNGQLDVSELHQGQYALEVITDAAKYVQRFVKY